MKKLLSLLFLASALLIVSCGKDDSDDEEPAGCVTTGLTYSADIKEILDTSCATTSCHSETEAMLQGSMHDYASAKAFVDVGRVEGAIKHEDGFEAMPRPTGSDKLNSCTIDKITAWIADGAPE
ncbi:MAG: hypothetical protein ACI8YQ_002793 [Polaribacter sp.]|jgi:hypothetical protein